MLYQTVCAFLSIDCITKLDGWSSVNGNEIGRTRNVQSSARQQKPESVPSLFEKGGNGLFPFGELRARMKNLLVRMVFKKGRLRTLN